MRLAAGAGLLRNRTGPKDAALRKERVCYNHLAGDMGTQLFDSLTAQRYLDRDGEDLILTDNGADFVTGFGIDLSSLRGHRSPLCRECLDWIERRSHLAGRLGWAFLTRFEQLSWASRDPNSRVVRFTKKGTNKFKQLFSMTGCSRPA